MTTRTQPKKSSFSNTSSSSSSTLQKTGRMKDLIPHGHWSQHVTDVKILAHSDGALGLTIKGGADFGEFAFLGELKQDRIRYQNPHNDNEGRVFQNDIILEVQGQSVAGFTQRDVVLWLKHCSRNATPVTLRCVQSGCLTKDLKEYLAGSFPKGSVDHELQSAIRDNLYMRTVPCTTREPRQNEINGQDYWFLSKNDFMELENDGHLLECGQHGGNFYGTPKPPHEPTPDSIPERPITDIIRPGGYPSAEGKRRRNRSNVEALSPGAAGDGSESTENLLSVLANKQHYCHGHPTGNGVYDNKENDNATTTRGGDGGGEESSGDSQRYVKQIPQMKEDGGFWKDIASQAMAKSRHHDSGHQSEDEHGRLADELLPDGWEKVDDPVYGTYYIDHVNKRTQYDHPNPPRRTEQQSSYNSSTFPRIKKRVSGSPETTRVPKSASSNVPFNGQNGRHILTTESLRGEFIDVVLIKSSQGLGFTVIGGEPTFPSADFEDDDLAGAGTLLQLKSIAPNGPADRDGRLRPGDVLVTINERSVLGYTHDQVIQLFQGIYPGDQVRMRVCRGYELPHDATDPRAQIITTDAVSSSSAGNTGSLGRNKARSFSTPSSRPPVSDARAVPTVDTNDDQEVAEAFDEQQLIPTGPLYKVNIAKGASGFGFNVRESADGQVIRKITDSKKCQGLMEGDLLVEINGYSVRGLDHKSFVDILKNAPSDIPSVFVVQRAQRIEGRKEQQRSSRFMGRSKTPTADMYKSQNSDSSQPKKQRSKTPTPRSTSSLFGFFRSKTPKPVKESSTEITTTTTVNTNDSRQRNGETSVMKTQRARTPEFKAASPAPVQQQQPPVSDFKRNQFAYSSMTRMVTPSYIPASQYVKKAEENQRNQQPVIHEVNRQEWNQPAPLHERRRNEVSFDQSEIPGSRPTALKINGYENSSLVSIPSSSIMEDNESQLHSPPGAIDLVVTLRKEEAGFGFRIVGGLEEDSQVHVGFIVPGGAAERDNRLEAGDDILSIDGHSVIGAEHRTVIEMMKKSSNNGYVVLGIRRKINYTAQPNIPRKVTIRRQPAEGFGFVIISSMARNQQFGGNPNSMQINYPILGRILDDSPAQHSGELHVGDKILAVNDVDVLHLHHSEIVQMIKESGNAVTLTILPQAVGVPDDASTISASSQQRFEDVEHHREPDNIYGQQPGTTRATERFEFYAIQLDRGTRGFGFSIRGGKEFHSMPLFVLRIAENGPAALDGRLRVGDEIIEINGVNTKDFTHGQAIELIKQGGSYVRLLIKRGAPSDRLTSPTRGLSSASLPLSPSNQSVQQQPQQYSSSRQYLDSNNNDRYTTTSPSYLTYASPSSLNYTGYGIPQTQSFPPVNGTNGGQMYQPTHLHSANAVFQRRPYSYDNPTK